MYDVIKESNFFDEDPKCSVVIKKHHSMVQLNTPTGFLLRSKNPPTSVLDRTQKPSNGEASSNAGALGNAVLLWTIPPRLPEFHQLL